MKKHFLFMSVLVCLSFSSCGTTVEDVKEQESIVADASSSSQSLGNDTEDNLASSIESSINVSTESVTESSNSTETNLIASDESSTDVPVESETAPETEVPHRSGDDIVGISDKDISDININYFGDVRNDVTGNWRYSMTADDFNIEDYALSYYKTYFNDNAEIHGIVNFTRKTTSSIRTFGDSFLFLDIYDYVDGEEKDAKLMFSGTLLKSYMIYTDNGDIELIQ